MPRVPLSQCQCPGRNVLIGTCDDCGAPVCHYCADVCASCLHFGCEVCGCDHECSEATTAIAELGSSKGGAS